MTFLLHPKLKPIVDVPITGNRTTDSVDTFKFRIVSYNILAGAYTNKEHFPASPPSCLNWETRSQEILTVLKGLKSDFFCIQELDQYDNFYKDNMEKVGYSSIYIQRTGRKKDGCGIFYKTNRAKFLHSEQIEYNDLVPSVPGVGQRDFHDSCVRLKRDCVGIMGAFELKDPSKHILVVANTHLFWDPKWADVKLAQAKYLLSCLSKFKATVSDRFGGNPSVILCGDFNSTPGDTVYQFLVSGSSSAVPPMDNSSESLPIPLTSVYALSGGEPPFTNRTPKFSNTIDYIFFSPSGVLKPVAVLEPLVPEFLDVVGGLPNFFHPSDHVPIGADFKVIQLNGPRQ